MTKALISILLAMSAAFGAMGQPSNGQPTGHHKSTGVFYGKIVDANTQKGVEGATIQLLQNRLDSATGKKKDVVLATQLSDKKGQFNIDRLPLTGAFKLKVSCVGYKPFDTKVSFDTDHKTGSTSDAVHAAIKDLGNFKLFADPEQLDPITINANKPLLQLYPDKKVYNVEKDLGATGGTALDIIKNVPGIIADMDGNISIRNASPQIFIDGRPTALSLDQVPSDQIASIEIMTNPSAKYDAGGTGGILNIVLKKNRRSGYNGNLRASIDSRYMPGGGADINIKQNKVNFFAAAQFNRRKSISDLTTDRVDYPLNATAITAQQNNPVNKGYFGFGRAGIDLLLTNRTTLSLSGNYMRGNFKVKDLLHIDKDTIYNSGTVSESALRSLSADIDFRNAGAAVGMKHNFAEAGKEWTADVSFNRNRNKNISDYFSRLFDANGNEKPARGAEKAEGGGSTSFYTFQTDFVNPISATRKFEAGARAVYRDYTSWNDNYRQDPPPSITYRLLPTTGVQFNFNDVVYAVYGTYSQRINKFSYQVGARLERFEYQGDLISKNEKFSNEYPVSLFPSLYLSHAISNREEIQLNYSRKVNRPGFFQILPFVDFSDSLNLSVGNPGLKPEFTQLAELSYNNSFDQKHSLLVTAYGKYSEGLITRYQYKAPNTDPAKTDSVIYNSFTNADRSYVYGLELTAKNKIGNWWDITSNINLFDVVLRASNIKGAGNNQLFSWFAKLNNSFKLPAKFTLQVSGDYQAKTILPANGRTSMGGFGGGVYGFTQNLAQGYIKPIYGVDIALQKDLFRDNSASVTLQVNDIFKTRTYETDATTDFFMQQNYRLRDPRVFRLSFSWRFGKFDAALFKRKNTKIDTDNLQMQQGAGQ